MDHEPRYDDEIDLRKILHTLFAGWKWIIGAAAICAVAALLAGALTEKYEATAQVFIDRNAIMDGYLEEPSDSFINDLVMDDHVVSSLLEYFMNHDDTAASNIENFRDDLSFSYQDLSLVLAVQNQDPGLAVDLVNQWATIITDHIQSTIGPSNDLLDGALNRRDQGESEWKEAQEAYLDFQATSEITVLSTRLGALENILISYIEADARLTQAKLDAESLLFQLELGEVANISIQDQLNLIIISFNSLLSTGFNNSIVSSDPLELDLMFDVGIEDMTIQGQIDYVESLISAILNRQASLDPIVSEVEQELGKINDQLESAIQQEHHLVVVRDLKQDIFTEASRELSDLEVAALHAEGASRVASEAIGAEETGISSVVRIGLGGVLGAILGLLGVYGMAWWKDE